MKERVLVYQSVEQFFEVLQVKKPSIPGFGLVHLKDLEVPDELDNVKVNCNFYSIMLNHTSVNLPYGNTEYKQDAGVLSFVAPGQVIAGSKETNSRKGWFINFSLKFLQSQRLINELNSFVFFSYEINTALKLTQQEEAFLNNMVGHIQDEIEHNDAFSKTIVQEHLGVLLHYSLRILDRDMKQSKALPTDKKAIAAQMNKLDKAIQQKTSLNILTAVDRLLNQYYEKEILQTNELPNIDYLADKLHYSKKHLSRLMQQHSQVKTTDYINSFVINRAKHLLLANPNQHVKNIAYALGFSEPAYFIRLFKKHTGKTPLQYRKS